jgi:hypothetical protein
MHDGPAAILRPSQRKSIFSSGSSENGQTVDNKLHVQQFLHHNATYAKEGFPILERNDLTLSHMT